MATTSDFVLQADASPFVREVKKAETALGQMNQKAKDFGADAIGNTLGLGRKFENLLESIAEKSVGLGTALSALGKGFVVFEAFKVGFNVGTVVRDFVLLGDSVENYEKRMELAARATQAFVDSARAAAIASSQARSALESARAAEAGARFSIIGGEAGDVGAAQANVRANLAAIAEQEKQLSLELDAFYAKQIEAAQQTLRERLALEEGFFTTLGNAVQVILGIDKSLQDKRIDLANEHARTIDAIEAQRVQKAAENEAKILQDKRTALAKYDAELDAAARREIARAAAAQSAIRAAIQATAQARRAAAAADLGVGLAGAQAGETVARAGFDLNATVEAIKRQQALQTEIVKAATRDRIAQAIFERDEAIKKAKEEVFARSKTEAEFNEIRVQENARAELRIAEAQAKGQQGLIELHTETFSKLDALREQELARVLAQQRQIADAIQARLKAEAEIRASALSGAGRTGEAAATTSAARLQAVEAELAKETTALREQLRTRQIDYQAYEQLTIEATRRAALERIKIRRDEMSAIRDLISAAAQVEAGLGIKNGLFKGQAEINQLAKDATTAAQAFAAMLAAGVPLDDIFASMEQHGAGFAKRFAVLAESFRSNPLLMKTLLGQAGDLESGNIRPRVEDARRGLAGSSLTQEQMRRAIGLARDDLRALSNEVDAASRSFGAVNTAPFVSQVDAAALKSTELDVVLDDIVKLLVQGIPTGVNTAIPALKQLADALDQVTRKAREADRATDEASGAPSTGGSQVITIDEGDDR